jgi:hypothetical protein
MRVEVFIRNAGPDFGGALWQVGDSTVAWRELVVLHRGAVTRMKILNPNRAFLSRFVCC